MKNEIRSTTPLAYSQSSSSHERSTTAENVLKSPSDEMAAFEHEPFAS